MQNSSLPDVCFSSYWAYTCQRQWGSTSLLNSASDFSRFTPSTATPARSLHQVAKRPSRTRGLPLYSTVALLVSSDVSLCSGLSPFGFPGLRPILVVQKLRVKVRLGISHVGSLYAQRITLPELVKCPCAASRDNVQLISFDI